MSLSSKIVEREIASIREIEEAIARQVLYGGDFVTNLFEVSRIEEEVLMPVVAESFGLPAAPLGELPRVPDEAAKLVAGEVALERGILPLSLGSSLVVAVAEPLSRDAEQELTFALAIPIEQQIAPLFRIRQALSRDYGVPMDKRTARLITKIVHKGPRMASTFPPPIESKPQFKAVPPRPPSVAPPPMPVPASLEAPRTKAAPEGTFVRKTEAPPARPTKRRRGPLTKDVALTELEASAERDVIFDLLFEFARQFFDYTALFTVHGEIAEGRDAFGDGSPRDKVARVGVPLDLSNILQRARDKKDILRSKPDAEGLDRVLMGDLGRDGSTECVVFPIIVRTRVVALLFGDGGLSGIDDIGVRQVEELVEAAAGAFERVIVRRKLKGSEPAQENRGAQEAKRKAADTVPPPPTQVSAPPPRSSRPNMTGPPAAFVITATSGGGVTNTEITEGPPASPSPGSPRRGSGSDRPAVEELAPPIRELMAEPVSRMAATRREPTPQVFVDPLSVRSDRPPPANLLAVRRPSGRPIPREEPEQPIVPSVLLGARPANRIRTPPPSQRAGAGGASKSGGHKRAEAPALEFGQPSMPSVITENTFGNDATERQLIAEIQGQPSPPPGAFAQQQVREPTSIEPVSPQAMSPPEQTAAGIPPAAGSGPGGSLSEPPKTTRDPSDAYRGDRDPSTPGHPWGRDPSSAGGASTDVPISEPFSAAPHSPKAESPPPMRAAPITDMSPQPIMPLLPLSSAPITPITDQSPPSIDFVRGEVKPPAPIAESPPPAAAAAPLGSQRNRTLLAGETPMLDPVVENPVSPIVVVTPDKEMKPVGLPVPSGAGALPGPITPAVTLSAEDLNAPDSSVTNDNKTPVAPPTFDESPAGGGVEPVLSLAQRKGMPPISMSLSEPKPMPPSEQQVSVPAHKPPSSRSDHSRILPSVIVDVSSEYVTLVDRVLAGPDEEAETDLLRAGGYAMAAIMAKFPGPILIETDRLLQDGVLPRVAECGPVIRLIASQRRTALPFVLSHVESSDLELRFWATYLLTELVYPDAIDAAIGRVFDEIPKVRRVARAATRALAEAHPTPVIDRLGQVARADRELWSRRVQAVEALGETREALAVGVLLPLLEDAAGDVTVAARQALVTITRQDFGLDPKKWMSWWEANKNRHRLEWLIDSLMHDQRALRGAASEELRTITKEYFAYYDDLPKRERERAQARYREWWENIGRVRFSRASTRGA